MNSDDKALAAVLLSRLPLPKESWEFARWRDMVSEACAMFGIELRNGKPGAEKVVAQRPQKPLAKNEEWLWTWAKAHTFLRKFGAFGAVGEEGALAKCIILLPPPSGPVGALVSAGALVLHGATREQVGRALETLGVIDAPTSDMPENWDYLRPHETTEQAIKRLIEVMGDEYQKFEAEGHPFSSQQLFEKLAPAIIRETRLKRWLMAMPEREAVRTSLAAALTDRDSTLDAVSLVIKVMEEYGMLPALPPPPAAAIEADA